MSRFYFSLIFRRNRDQTRQTLGVPFLFQCNFLLVVRVDNLIWQIFFFIGFFRHDARSVLKFGFSLPSACTQTFPRINQASKLNSGRVSCYMLIKYKGKPSFFDIKRDSWIQIRKILSDATLVMLERTMYLAITLLLVKYRFQNHWSDVKHNAKVRTVN